MPLTSYADTLRTAIALGGASPTATETVALADAAGRTVADEIAVPISLPPFDGSAMDGYAVRAADTAGAAGEGAPVLLRLVDESRAGHPAAVVVGPGEATRISTGARMPTGADAVVRVEDTDEPVDDDGAARVAVRVAVAPGHDVRPAGEDVTAGDRALAAGDLLHPGRLALLAGLGVVEVAVRRAPSVTVIATGDEVRVGGGPLEDGQVHDVHGAALPALLRAAGAGAVDVVRVGDDRQATIDAFAGATGDVLVSCGGASVGRHDHVRPALDALGATEAVFGVDLQPGKPTWIGGATVGGRRRLIFGLPGNPASAYVTACLFVAPALRAMLGRPPAPRTVGRLGAEASPDRRRTRALRARLAVADDGVLTVRPLGPQHSHRLRPLADGEVLALLPAGDGPLPAGATVELVPIPGTAAPW
ncbi:MAG: molybdopterin molybdotransferase MoeA [Patulibacter sp.]|nr:molybdopterin molybdotransferase MoeA [Patulibacter sp.]